jgi:hypothetical protein
MLHGVCWRTQEVPVCPSYPVLLIKYSSVHIVHVRSTVHLVRVYEYVVCMIPINCEEPTSIINYYNHFSRRRFLQKTIVRRARFLVINALALIDSTDRSTTFVITFILIRNIRTNLCGLLPGCLLDIHEYIRAPFRLTNRSISDVVPQLPQHSSTFVVVVVSRCGNLQFQKAKSAPAG